MSHLFTMSPKLMKRVVRDSVVEDLDGILYSLTDATVEQYLWENVFQAARNAANWAVFDAGWRAFRNQPLHPNFDKFIDEIEQKWGVG